MAHGSSTAVPSQAASGSDPSVSPAILAEGLRKSYRGTVAVDGVNLVGEAGAVLGLLGPIGAGKTTVVHMLTTLVAPDAGRASVAGHDVVTHAR